MEVPLPAMIDVSFLLLAYFIVIQSDPKEEAYIQTNSAAKPSNSHIIDATSFDIHIQSEYFSIAGNNYPSLDADLTQLITQLSQDLAGLDYKVNLKISS